MAHDLTPEQKAALKAFALRNGRCWKSRLRALWMNGRDEREANAAALRQLRNSIGPSGLTRLATTDLD